MLVMGGYEGPGPSPHLELMAHIHAEPDVPVSEIVRAVLDRIEVRVLVADWLRCGDSSREAANCVAKSGVEFAEQQKRREGFRLVADQ